MVWFIWYIGVGFWFWAGVSDGAFEEVFIVEEGCPFEAAGAFVFDFG